MARTPNPFKRLALLALLCCPGCASRRSSQPVDTGGVPITVDGNGGLGSSLLQDVSNASINNWNFRKIGW
jgi:hypothetical protein